MTSQGSSAQAMKLRIWAPMNLIKYTRTILILSGMLIFSGQLTAQADSDALKKRGDLRIMFYNVENFFDTLDDPHSRDNEFLPDSDKHWNGYKYYEKTRNIFKVTAAVGEMSPPELIGLCEVENISVLIKLCYTTGLSKFPYKIIHFDSPDLRGIDVGMLYRKDRLELLGAEPLRIRFPENPRKKTRDILYGKFLCNSSDTLHVFVNHWPSRYGGQEKSEPSRKYVAGILRSRIDSLLVIDPCAAIVVMGDLNDGPEDPSVRNVLKGKPNEGKVNCSGLYNLAIEPVVDQVKGTHRYKAHWDTFDQFLVTGALLDKQTGRLYSSSAMIIADFPFLLEEDKTYGGLKPNRTYFGPHYHGGFSDHLPVFIDIWLK